MRASSWPTMFTNCKQVKLRQGRVGIGELHKGVVCGPLLHFDIFMPFKNKHVVGLKP